MDLREKGSTTEATPFATFAKRHGVDAATIGLLAPFLLGARGGELGQCSKLNSGGELDVIGCSRTREPPSRRSDGSRSPSAELGALFCWGRAMTDLEWRLDRFETLAAECELIAKLATDGSKRELHLRLALHYRELVADMRKAIATKAAA